MGTARCTGYSYSTNSGDVLTYSMNNINNFGIRVGISF